MKTSLLLCSALLFATSLSAAEVVSQNLVIPIGGSPEIVIPAAGAVQGANGTFFRSDINLLNYTNHDQLVQLRWLPAGASGNGVAMRQITLNALTGTGSEDFVTNVLQESGLGAILITGVTADGSPDPTARLYATSRIWSNQPGLSSGTVSQSFPSIPTANINSSALSLTGLHRDDRFRLNVGIVNLDPVNSQTFQIAIAGVGTAPETTTVTIAPRSMTQTSLVGASLTTPQVIVQNVSTPVRTNSWIAYGSSVDNATGDSWSEVGYTGGQ